MRSLKFWLLMDVENEKSVNHSDSILCFTVTHDCATVVTGSNDMSLKVWEVATGKLTQVRLLERDRDIATSNKQREPIS